MTHKTLYIDAGEKFGRLVVLSNVGKGRCECVCSCGNTIVTYKYHLLSGHTQSCGCLKKERLRESKITHGLSKHRLTSVWHNMHKRCYDKKHTDFHSYGGRGICVEHCWNKDNPNGLSNFIEDMYPTFKEGLTIDRQDVNGNYAKANCQWATDSTQNHNRRKKINCSSLFVGVSWAKERGKWEAYICKNKKRHHLGRYTDELAAARAYDDASEEIFGNRPNSTERVK